MSRAEIARHASLSRATVSSVVADLQHAGLVIEEPLSSDGSAPAGRPPALLRLDAAAGAALGIDFGKRHLRVVATDLGHQLLAERALVMASDHDASHGIDVAARLVDEVLDEAGISRSRIVGVGMGIPGPIDQTSGELGSSTILPGWVGIRAAEAMTERLGLEVSVDNDANLGAMSEWTWGAGRRYADVAYLKVATGIGAGLIVGGRLHRGASGTAGEIGHTIVDPNGPVCRCGNRGCLETLVGAPALLKMLEQTHGELSIRDAIALAESGDAGSRRVIGDAGAAIGSAAATLCNLFNPARIVVGGDLGAAGELLLAPMRDAIARAAIPSAAEHVAVVAGELGERAEVLGAIALVLRDGGVVAADLEAGVDAVSSGRRFDRVKAGVTR